MVAHPAAGGAARRPTARKGEASEWLRSSFDAPRLLTDLGVASGRPCPRTSIALVAATSYFRSARSYCYRLHDTTGDDLVTSEHPAPNVEAGDVLILGDGREALVTCRAKTDGGPLVALLEVVIGQSASQPTPT